MDNGIAERLARRECDVIDYTYVFIKIIMLIAILSVNIWYLTLLNKNDNCIFPLYELGTAVTYISILLAVYFITFILYVYFFLYNLSEEMDYGIRLKVLTVILIFISCIVYIASCVLVGIYITLLVFVIKYPLEDCYNGAFDNLPEYLFISFAIGCLSGIFRICFTIKELITA
jgi:hypothetical protein